MLRTQAAIVSLLVVTKSNDNYLSAIGDVTKTDFIENRSFYVHCIR